MGEERTVLPRDRHGRLPRMHYDANESRSPTTRADLLAWCVAQRGEPAIASMVNIAMTLTINDLLGGRIDVDRAGRMASDVLGAFDLAADDLHLLVREFGYDPTGVGSLGSICSSIVVDRILETVKDVGPPGDPVLARAVPARDELRHLLHIAAIGTTLVAALQGATDPRRALDALTLAYEESEHPDLRKQLSDAISQVRGMLRP